MKRSACLRLALVAPWALRDVIAGGGTGGRHDPVSAAVSWLLAKQSRDGAWRSDAYGGFRSGGALTPVVLRALAPHPAARTACLAACGWLHGHRESLLHDYPVHAAAAVLESAATFRDELGRTAVLAVQRLLDLQCRRTGGWSYAPVASGGANVSPLPPMQQANLAATAIALDGLAAAGLPSVQRCMQRALPFVHSCQNFGNGIFDDGGFFQMPDDPSRSKAGVAGIDAQGVPRCRSYAAATADGIRALRHAGEEPASPRIRAARDWLDRHGNSLHIPPDLKYYTARSIAKCGGRVPGIWADQEPDGSWRNPAGEMREDCPVVATALALEAVQTSRES